MPDTTFMLAALFIVWAVGLLFRMARAVERIGSELARLRNLAERRQPR